MTWFITYKTEGGEERTEHFFSVESMLKWFQDYWGRVGRFPPALGIYKAECCFDGS